MDQERSQLAHGQLAHGQAWLRDFPPPPEHGTALRLGSRARGDVKNSSRLTLDSLKSTVYKGISSCAGMSRERDCNTVPYEDIAANAVCRTVVTKD